MRTMKTGLCGPACGRFERVVKLFFVIRHLAILPFPVGWMLMFGSLPLPVGGLC
jgi:hypothetical protein